MDDLEVVEICAGAGGQSLGLHLAGFRHRLAIELDPQAAQTLRENLARLHRQDDGSDVPAPEVAVGDVANRDVWNPAKHKNVALLAGGVPCPPFSLAGKQHGATDERDLFAWAVAQVRVIKPRALLLENVRGLMGSRFDGYRQEVRDQLEDMGYRVFWRLLQASDYGVPQLRPRSVLVALRPREAAYFEWPEPKPFDGGVGDVLLDLMAANGWPGAEAWADQARSIAPTIVGGSKKHGGADLGPRRAKAAWATMRVDALGVADSAPDKTFPIMGAPKLTVEMVKRIQGWLDEPKYHWTFTGRKTSTYRQIGNAFPPPVAEAVGRQVAKALRREGPRKRAAAEAERSFEDSLYRLLRDADCFVSLLWLSDQLGCSTEATSRRLDALQQDFVIEVKRSDGDQHYMLGEFKAFQGQKDHPRHKLFVSHRSRIS